MKRIVLIGYGNIAIKHLEVFRALDCEIVASCNRSKEGNRIAHESSGIPITYTDFHTMIIERKPDGIIVCVSFDRIYDVVDQLMPYGIPLLIEKPTGTSLKEHLALVEKAKFYVTPTQVALNRRHYSVIQRALQDCGGLSNITSIVMEWSENIPHLQNKLTPQQIELSNFRNTIHGLDLINYLSGGVAEEKFGAQYFGAPHRHIFHLQGIGSANKALISFYSTWEMPIPWKLMWTANGKRYQFMPMETCQVFDDSSKDNYQIHPDANDSKFKPGFFSQAQMFIDLINGKSNNMSLEEVIPSMILCQEFTKKILPITE
jgi:predicted dehydrogenase